MSLRATGTTVPAVPASATLREALSLLLAERAVIAFVRGEAGDASTRASIRDHGARRSAKAR